MFQKYMKKEPFFKLFYNEDVSFAKRAFFASLAIFMIWRAVGCLWTRFSKNIWRGLRDI